MKKALELYDELKDAFHYLCVSWLKYKPNPATEDDANVILSAGAFLFDNLFAKQNAGKEITEAVAKDLGKEFRPKKLPETATKIRLNMSKEDMEKGGTPLRNYVLWVGEEHPVILKAMEDDYGLLVLALAEEVSDLILEQNKDLIPVETAELTLLQLTQCLSFHYKELLGPTFKSIKSYDFFADVEEEMERIAADIAS